MRARKDHWERIHQKKSPTDFSWYQKEPKLSLDMIREAGIAKRTRCSGLDVVQYDAEKLCAELGDDFRLMSDAQEIHVTPDRNEQEFGFFRFAFTADSLGANCNAPNQWEN